MPTFAKLTRPKTLSISLGVAPSAQTERLYQSLKREAVGG